MKTKVIDVVTNHAFPKFLAYAEDKQKRVFNRKDRRALKTNLRRAVSSKAKTWKPPK